jgi:hypothetical protein
MMMACRVLVLLAVMNFVAFWFESAALGGDALNGKQENGHFYVAEHGKYTEVSESQFEFSAWHTRSIFVTHALGILAALVLYGAKDPFVTKKNPKRDAAIGVAAALSVGIGIAGGKGLYWVPLIVVPVAVLTAVLLHFRDTSGVAPSGEPRP